MKSFRRRVYSVILIMFLSVFTGVFFINCSGEGFDAFEEKVMAGADPLIPLAWYLLNTGQGTFSKRMGSPGNDLQLIQTWEAGIQGRGITILVSDDGIDHSHEDLNANMKPGNVHLNFSSSDAFTNSASALPPKASSNHGTNVAGLIAGVRGNSVGVAGVAPLANIVSSNFLDMGMSEYSMAEQVKANVDIVNMSWGSKQTELSEEIPLFLSGMATGVLNGRNGLGRIYVKSSGNEFKVGCATGYSGYCLGNANFDVDNTTPFTIIVAALQAQPYAASYSSPGANVWISSPGGENNEDYPTIVTTDRTGCTVGVANRSSKSARSFERGGGGNTDCKYTTLFAGTSAAAPLVSGAIALILEANPTLNWREVKHVLASTATKVHSNIGSTNHPLGMLSPSGHIYEQGWVRNKAGYDFHNWYGFGRINVDAAVQMAANFGNRFGLVRNATASSSFPTPLDIPDGSATGVTNSIYLSENLVTEAVQITVTISHTYLGNLGIELTSPQGTKSIIWNVNNGLKGIQNLTNRQFLTNAFYGERSKGNWMLKVIDGTSGNTGTLDSWSIKVMGRD